MESEVKISITGDATISRRPDIAYITLYIRANGILLEDAIKEASDKIEQVNKTLRDTFSDIQETLIRDMYIGESKSHWTREKSESPQPEVIKGLLVTIPPQPDLATKIVDRASRMGCIIQNPAEDRILAYPRGVVMYGLAQYTETEQEAIEMALTDAKENAARVAKILNKKVGVIKKITSVETLRIKAKVDTYTRSEKNNTMVLPTCYLSVSPDNVELSARLAVVFEMTD